MSEKPGGSIGVEAAPRNRRRRGLWFVVFFVGGVIGIFSVLLSLFDLGSGLPWIGASSALVAFAGYSIWRIDHPHLSARRTILERLKSVVTGVAAIGAILVIRDDPARAGVVIAVLLVTLLGLFLVVDRVGRAADEKPKR